MQELLKWAGWIVAFIATIFAIRGTIKFDVNKWIEDRRNRKEEILRSLCPHVRVSKSANGLVIKTTYISPPGTVGWQCQQCGHFTYDDDAVNETAEFWGTHLGELNRRNRKMDKLAKKLGRRP